MGTWDDGEEEEGDLYAGLSGVQLFFGVDGAGLEEHVDEHVEQAGGVATERVPVDAPFVDDAEDEVAEDGLEEDHARHEVAPDVDLGFEEARVDERPHQTVGHVLWKLARMTRKDIPTYHPAHQNRQLHLEAV
jgi:hypothetical protein